MLMTANITNKLQSTKLANLFVEINSTFGHAKELVVKAYNLAIEEGYLPEEAKQLLLDNITAFKKTQIYACLPQECKNSVKQRAGSVSHRMDVSVPTSEQNTETNSISDSSPSPQATKVDNHIAKLQSENITLRREIEHISNNVIPEALLKKDRKIGELQNEIADLEFKYKKKIERLNSTITKDSSVSASNIEQHSDHEHLRNQVPRIYERELPLLGGLTLPLRVLVYPQTDECIVEVDKDLARDVFTQVCKELVTDKTE